MKLPVPTSQDCRRYMYLSPNKEVLIQRKKLDSKHEDAINGLTGLRKGQFPGGSDVVIDTCTKVACCERFRSSVGFWIFDFFDG